MAVTDADGDGLLVDAQDHLLEMSALNCTQEALEAQNIRIRSNAQTIPF